MIKAVVTDIEGTTSSLSFVKDVLFPYARAHIGEFVRRHHQQADVAQLLKDVAAQAGKELNLEQSIEQLIAWIDEDKKITPLKALQGLLWEKGYGDGDFQGHIYADARQKLQAWKDQGLALYVYSSGSVYAQKLLFAHTAYGDLTPLFSGYFDTRVGAKKQADSYREIAAQLGLPANQILFLSDIEQELQAADSVGMQTYWLLRDGEPDAQAAYRQVRDFMQIVID